MCPIEQVCGHRWFRRGILAPSLTFCFPVSPISHDYAPSPNSSFTFRLVLEVCFTNGVVRCFFTAPWVPSVAGVRGALHRCRCWAPPCSSLAPSCGWCQWRTSLAIRLSSPDWKSASLMELMELLAFIMSSSPLPEPGSSEGGSWSTCAMYDCCCCCACAV